MIRNLMIAAALLSAPAVHAQTARGSAAQEGVQGDDTVRAVAALSFPLRLDGGVVWITALTDATSMGLWSGMAAQDNLRTVAASGGTVFFVSGIAGRNFEFVPGSRVEQDGAGPDSTGKDALVVNVHNLSGGTVGSGETVIGLVEGPSIDLARPFRFTLGGRTVDVAFAPDAVARWGHLSPPKPVFRAPETKPTQARKRTPGS